MAKKKPAEVVGSFNTCPFCTNLLDDRVHYTVSDGSKKPETLEVCGRCFLLVSMVDELKSLRKEFGKWLTLKTSESLQS